MPTTTNYIWDENNLLAEADGSNVVQTVYTNEPEQYGNLISSRISGTTSYHHFDALGSTRQLTNAAGTVTDTPWSPPMQSTAMRTVMNEFHPSCTAPARGETGERGGALTDRPCSERPSCRGSTRSG